MSWTEKYEGLVGAILNGDTDLVEVLLQQGADPNEAGPAFNEGGTVLHLALLYNHHDIMKLLVEKGADINAVNDKNQTPLIFSLRYYKDSYAMNYFIEKGVSLDEKDDQDWTALNWAIFNNRGEAVDILENALKLEQERAEEKAVEEAARRKNMSLHDTALTRQDALKKLRPKMVVRP